MEDGQQWKREKGRAGMHKGKIMCICAGLSEGRPKSNGELRLDGAPTHCQLDDSNRGCKDS